MFEIICNNCIMNRYFYQPGLFVGGYISLIWRRHYCFWKGCEYRTILGTASKVIDGSSACLSHSDKGHWFVWSFRRVRDTLSLVQCVKKLILILYLQKWHNSKIKIHDAILFGFNSCLKQSRGNKHLLNICKHCMINSCMH